MKPRPVVELTAFALLLASVLVVVYSIATWLSAMTHGGSVFRGEIWLAGVVGPLSILMLALAVPAFLVERGARGASTRAVEALRTMSMMFVLVGAGFAFVLVSGVFSPRALEFPRIWAGIGAGIVVLAPPAAILLVRQAKLVRGVGFAASFLVVLPLGLAGSVPAGHWLVVRLSG